MEYHRISLNITCWRILTIMIVLYVNLTLHNYHILPTILHISILKGVSSATQKPPFLRYGWMPLMPGTTSANGSARRVSCWWFDHPIDGPCEKLPWNNNPPYFGGVSPWGNSHIGDTAILVIQKNMCDIRKGYYLLLFPWEIFMIPYGGFSMETRYCWVAFAAGSTRGPIMQL